MLNWRIVGFYLILPLLALAVMAGVHFKTDLSAFIIAGDNSQEILLASEMQSGALSRRYLISVGSVNQKAVPEAFMQALKMQFKAIDGVIDVWSPGQNTDDPETLRALYGAYAGAWYSLNPERDLAQLFSEQGLMQRAELLKKSLLSPQATVVKKMALQDPLLLVLNGFQAQGSKMQQTLKEEGAYRNLILETTVTGLDVPQQKRIQTALSAAFDIFNNASAEHYQLEMTGVPVFAVATQTLIQGDIQLVSFLSAIGLLLLFLLVFRSHSALLQVFSILSIVILAAILITQLVFGYVHGMTVAIGSTLVGICIDYPIHAIAHAQTVKPQDRLAVIARIWPSMVLGGLTTLVGYMVLGASGYPGFKQVAVYASSGIIISLLLTRFVLPGLLENQSSRPLNVALVTHWVVFCQRFRPWLIGLLVIVVLTSLVGLKSLRWMDDMQELTPELNYLKQTDKRIRERMTSIEPGRFVLIAAQNIEAALQKSEAVYLVLDQLKQSKQLTEYYGLYPWLLSAQQQQLNQARLQAHLTPANLLLWQQALTQQNLSVEKLGHFNYAKTEPLTLKQVQATPIKKLLDNRIVQGEHQTIIMIWLAEHQPDVVRAALANLDGVQYFSQRDLLNNMVRDYTDRAQRLLIVGLAIIVLLMMSRYKNWTTTIQTLLPAVLSAVIVLGILSLTGAAISFLHLVGFLLVVAICVDYGIFYQENRGGDIVLTYQAMGAAMLTSALAFACLMISESTSLKILSGVVVLGVVLGFLLCPIIIKSNHHRVT
ncbi:MAG: MMPL family transporter [Methylococcales bacterium]|nr:MMPL family transporter [Methylococcales bacterium]